MQREHLDADVAMWAILTHLKPDKLPPRRLVVRFEFSDDKRRYWLVLRRDDPDLCFSDPGFGDDLVIRTDLECVTRVYLGELKLADAKRSGRMAVEGSRELSRDVDEWFPISSFASHARPVKFQRSSGSFVRASSFRDAVTPQA